MEVTMPFIVEAESFTTDEAYDAFFASFDIIETPNLLYYVEKEKS